MRKVCFENMALTVTEEWIRERVKLKHNNLEDVRSLSLPGTYHEKIGGLGDAFRNFSRLKCLDLSRNAIESLQGLQSLKMMEKLILYYNNVGSLQELYRLRYNQRLQEIDLRLNPVARNEPDYRLFLVHMLPNLRRLDDRAVRDSERRAALMHFSTDQATELTEHAQRPLTPPQSTNPRTEQVKSLAKPPNVVDEDEANLLDYASKKWEELKQARQITGSRATQPEMEEYPPHVARQMDRGIRPSGDQQMHYSLTSMPQITTTRPLRTSSPAPDGQNTMTHTSQVIPDDLLKRYPNLMAPSGGEASVPAGYAQERYGVRPEDQMYTKSRAQPVQDPNLQYQDEIEAYTSYKAKGYFTPHPDIPEPAEPVPEPQNPPQHQQPQQDAAGFPMYDAASNIQPSAEFYNHQELPLPPSKQSEPSSKLLSDSVEGATDHQVEPREEEAKHTEEAKYTEDIPLTGEFGQFVSRVSDLVDKYWNGSKSLLKNTRFKHHMASMFQELQQTGPEPRTERSPSGLRPQDIDKLRQELAQSREENTRLRDRTLEMMEVAGGVTGEDGKSKGSMIRAHRDVSILRGRLQKSIEENKSLQERIAALESGQISSQEGASVTMSADVESIKKENERLRGEILSLGIRQKQASQMQELAAMLQESHKSLVQTNEHLLKELEDTRRHASGAPSGRQWNYKKPADGQQYPAMHPGKAHNGAH